MSAIAAVILAAGMSSRMPGNKLLAVLGGKPVVRHVAEAARASRTSPVLVVVGHGASQVRSALGGMDLTFVENRDYAKGLSESLKCGVRNVPAHCDGVIVLLGDMPFVFTDQINTIVQSFDPERGHTICVPVRGGRRGNPVLWSRRFFPELLALEGDRGAKGLMARHEDVLYEVAMSDDGALIDIDTPEDLKRHE